MTIELLPAGPAPSRIIIQTVETEMGPVTVAASERGLLRVDFGFRPDGAVLGSVFPSRDRSEVTVERGEVDVAPQLRGYFAREIQSFSVGLDLFGLGEFACRVYKALAKIPFGKCTTYGALAATVGSPQAARAVGGAVGRNPWVVVLPCHRVVAADGTLGGFSAGLPRKRELHRIEGLVPPAGGWEPRAQAS